MKARFALACAAAGIAASAFAGTASADDSSGAIGFFPEVVEPGYGVDQTVTGYLRVVAAELPPLRPSISIEPRKGIPGTKVEIYVVCSERQPVTSAALAIDSVAELPGGGAGQPYFVVTGKVKKVKPGTYKVTSTCAGKSISTSFTVLAPEPMKGQVPVKPKKAPETGDA
jgi:hypothetical protein